ncbi:MAG TPA: haloacid dehalogenase-like hydrolase [Gaiellaceae bacterium]|jgi:2-hydroxy-3-keto-5-methylthiopentenyl-1-phosphate phosphatase
MRLVIDWDGTVTVADTMDLIVREFGDAELVDRFSDAFIDDSKPLPVTLQHVVESEMATIKAPLAEVVEWLIEKVELRPGFVELAGRERPLLLSSNIRQLIQPVLEHYGIEADLLANELVSDGEAGWRVRFDGELCPVCGERCKRPKLPSGEVVYVGNGYSDRCPALASARVFARCGLARYLDAVGAPYEPFGDFHQIASALERAS